MSPEVMTMTLVLLLKLLNLIPTLQQEATAAIKELSSDDDTNAKIKAEIAVAQQALKAISDAL